MDANEQVNKWYEDYRKEKKPHGFTSSTEILLWLAEKLAKNISINPDVIKSVCDHAGFRHYSEIDGFVYCTNCGNVMP